MKFQFIKNPFLYFITISKFDFILCDDTLKKIHWHHAKTKQVCVLSTAESMVKFSSCKLEMSTFANNEDPDEMQHYAAFHLGLHCL